MRSRLPRQAKARTFRSWITPKDSPYDQLETSECVAFTGKLYLPTHPIYNKFIFLSTTVLYKLCQRVDEWPGEDYDGTSIRALCKILREHGLIGNYFWADTVETICQHALHVGPVLMGTTMFWEMFVPDRWGYIQPEGEAVGGHAWLIVAVNLNRKNPDGTIGAVRMQNSWGPGWGEKGRAWITLAHLQILLDDWGEAAACTELKKAA